MVVDASKGQETRTRNKDKKEGQEGRTNTAAAAGARVVGSVVASAARVAESAWIDLIIVVIGMGWMDGW